MKAPATVGAVMAMLGAYGSQVGAAPAGMPVAHRLIDVPYLSQAKEPGAGEALVMVFRYWGDRRVMPVDFTSLATPSERGVVTSDLVEAVTSRGWQAIASQGPSSAPLSELQRQVDQGRPVIALVEAAPGRLRYVVIVGVTPASVVLHDPASSSFHVAAADEFDREWRGSNRWRLVVLPPPTARATSGPGDAPVASGVPTLGHAAGSDQRVRRAGGSRGRDRGNGRSGGAIARRRARLVPRKRQSAARARHAAVQGLVVGRCRAPRRAGG